MRRRNFESNKRKKDIHNIIELLLDRDFDGLADTYEDLNADGSVDVVFLNGTIAVGETDPLNPDSDGDSIHDGDDNCSLIGNADQRDTDFDLIGNSCDPDLNNDFLVNFIDLQAMKLVFFGFEDNADLNGDGVVNFADLQIMTALFLSVAGPSGPRTDL